MSVPPVVVMAIMARTLLGDERQSLRVGDITLHPHQTSAFGRIQETLSKHNGALLCDEVGLGKTYVALALASSYDAVAIVAPAALREMWRGALKATGVVAEFVSMESLGRGGATDRTRTLLIVDEAHHFRNPCTRRYAALARLCTLTPVLLLTATPLHNSRDDVAALAALFMGTEAYRMTDADLARVTIRRVAMSGTGVQNIPVLEHSPPRVVIVDEAILDSIRALPPPVPPRGGSVATQLVIHGLARQWASSGAALTAALKRRIARSHSLLDSLDAGRYPTANELAAWVYLGDAVQLAFGDLLVPDNVPPSSVASALREHVNALTALLMRARNLDDAALIAYIRAIRDAHPNERIVAFSCYAETAEALYRGLRHDGHVALLTARGALIASGPVRRAEVLGQFDPESSASRNIGLHNSIRLLLATDLLSEGVNLQCASVVIHLDIPWTAARVQQRIGRLVRLGSPHARVVSYTVSPPPMAEECLHELELIAKKAGISEQLLGAPLEARHHAVSGSRAIGENEHIRSLLASWRNAKAAIDADPAGPCVAYLAGSERGALGAWLVDGSPILLSLDSSGFMTDKSCGVLGAAERVAELQSVVAADDPVALSSVLEGAIAWNKRRLAWTAVVGSSDCQPEMPRHDIRRTLARVADTTVTNSTFARRFQSASIATRLRNAATRSVPLAVEWSLEGLSDYADDAAVNTILDLIETARPIAAGVREVGFRCIALIVFVPDATPMA
ncbi:MAG: DEAD/DEAH box helicase [Gemmatimonadaceae bacterium]